MTRFGQSQARIEDHVVIFPWNDNFATGIASIDEQHSNLVELINRLALQLTAGSGDLVLGGILDELTDYAAYHFRSEEKIMHEWIAGDPLETEHLQSHADFEAEIGRFRAEAGGRPTEEMFEDILSFLTHWLAFHILESDKRMAKVVLALREGKSLAEAKSSSEGQMSGAMRVLVDTILNMYDSLTGRTLQLMREIVERQKAEAKLRLAGNVIENTLEAIFITDAEGSIIDVNPAFCATIGCDVVAAEGRNISDLQLGLERTSPIWKIVASEGHWIGEIWNRTKAGEATQEWLTLSAIRDESDTIINYIGVFSNVSQLVERQQQLQHIASHDALTGLPNRLLLMDRLSQAAADIRRHPDHSLALFFVDLDGFKAVNDRFGHEAGDRVLREVAARMTQRLRPTDTVCRLGGDEFVVLLTQIKHAPDWLSTLERLMATVSEPVALDDATVSVGISVGISVYPADTDNVDRLIPLADQAMYRAKQQGKGRYVLWRDMTDEVT